MSAYGMSPRQLGAAQDYGFGASAVWSVPWVISVQTEASTTAYTLVDNKNPRTRDFRVIKAWGYMTGAGGASDTAVITDGTNSITDTADLSVMSDTDQFDFSQINDAYNTISPTEKLAVTTASDALCRIYVMCEWV
jgi:hypothetical protein